MKQLSLLDINNLSILSVLDKLGIEYKRFGDNFRIIEGSKVTDGWVINVNENYIKDFNEFKLRASGGPYAFVMQYLGLSSRDVFKWFNTHY